MYRAPRAPILSTLDPHRLTRTDYVDLSNKAKFLFRLLPSYETTSIFFDVAPKKGVKSAFPSKRAISFPPNTAGFLYYHTPSGDASPFEGGLRIRVTPDNSSWGFDRGRDLLAPTGFPWQTNLLQIARVVRWQHVRETLLQENLVTPARLAWCRECAPPFITIPLLSLFRLTQEFPIVFESQNPFAFVGDRVYPSSVSNLLSQFAKVDPFGWPTGSISARFEPAIRDGRRMVHLRITRAAEHHIEGPVVKPEEGQLLHLRFPGEMQARPWGFDIDATRGDGAAGLRMLWDAAKM
ncbi:hypothetical protein B0H16DRAFT_1572520 [Mycena metata]|uniref:Uncharacterized protein n=1 Tax=Mycena metata TaxID=1033252 RepID=A0AAD7I7X0_9AGAR|nr:hypothetical protein B0H16DRAFT_1572520 [Mycena metata]